MKVWMFLGLMLWVMGGIVQAQPLKWQDRRFMIDECGIRYNGKPLPLGQDTLEWVRVLGPPDRRLPSVYYDMLARRDIRYLVWDSHGLALKLGDTPDTLWVQSVIFFFMGLDSEEGRANSLNTAEDYAVQYEPFPEKVLAEFRAIFGDGGDGSQLYFRGDLRNFAYPVPPVRSQVRLDGLLLHPYISLDSLNGIRSAMGLPSFKAKLLFGDWRAKLKAYYQPRKPGIPPPKTLSGIYALISPRLCQDISYLWVLRYSDWGRLVHLRISTYRPWENAVTIESQKNSDEYRATHLIGHKDGKKTWYQ